MDARSIAATALNGGKITAATDVTPTRYAHPAYHFDASAYENGFTTAMASSNPEQELVMGPNITDWPEDVPAGENLLVQLAAVIHDPVDDHRRADPLLARLPPTAAILCVWRSSPCPAGAGLCGPGQRNRPAGGRRRAGHLPAELRLS